MKLLLALLAALLAAPASAALTTDAYPDIAPYKDRHMAVVREDDWFAWLRRERPVAELLRPFPFGSFQVTGPRRPRPRVAAVASDLFADVH